jgi:hypothetical protein
VDGLPPEASIYRDEFQGWTVTDALLADLFHALTGEAHPSRPGRTSRADAVRSKIDALKAQRERLDRQREART